MRHLTALPNEVQKAKNARSPKPRSRGDEALLKQIGRRVASLRLSQELTPEELAKKAKLHRSYVRKLEQGSVNPSALVLASVARALNVEFADLLRFSS